MLRSLRHFAPRCLRLVATHSVRPKPPTTPRVQDALHQLASLPEITQASQTPDAQLEKTLLNRVLHLVSGTPTDAVSSPRPSMGKNYEAVVHGLLARHFHRVGDITSERFHRLESISALWLDATTHPIQAITHGDYQNLSYDDRALLAASHIALALSCLRAPGSEPQLAASAAAATAERFAVTEQHRLAASLLLALSSEKGSPRQTMMLSALTAIDNNGAEAPVDVPGIARYFLATTAGESTDTDINPVDHAQALVVRWDTRGGFDYIEALCAAALILIKRQDKLALDQAEDFLGRALKEVEGIGNNLDKSEPLLTLAKLYTTRGQIVEAEGMYRAVEQYFDPVLKRMAFTVSSADLYCRAMEAFAGFLEKVEFNAVLREKEGAAKREKKRPVKEMYPAILCGGEEDRFVPLWLIDSMLPQFDMASPELATSR